MGYERVRQFESRTNSARINIQYKPLCPWLKPLKVIMVADDRTGLTPEEVANVLASLTSHTVTLFELAVDFLPSARVCEQTLRKYLRCGKSRLYLGKIGQPRFGSRASPKLVRFYEKANINRFRLEVEAHRTLIRKYSISSVRELGTLAVKLSPAHIRFASVRWKKLRKYLIHRFGPTRAKTLYADAYAYGEHSVRRVTRFLSRSGVPNPHRFLRSMPINAEIQLALRCWAENWNDRMQLDAS